MSCGFPALDRAGHLNGAAEQQQLFGEGGLTRVGWEMIAKVRRFPISLAISSASTLVPVTLCLSVNQIRRRAFGPASDETPGEAATSRPGPNDLEEDWHR